MALYYGGISVSSWTDLVDYIKTILTTQLGMTVVSDTGTGNARVLDVSATGYDHNIRFLYVARPNVSILGIDGTTELHPGAFVYANNNVGSYYAIKYNDTIALFVYDASGNKWCSVFLLCKSGTRTHHMGTYSNYSSYTLHGIVSGTSDHVQINHGGYYASTTLHTISGKDILSPIILPYDENGGPLCDDYLNDFLACESNLGAFTAKYAIGSAKYICIPVFNTHAMTLHYLMRYE